ncbi:MAG TPA: beta/gamma crystallin-related protein [Ktedonobacteraceae bacterium]|nr:beta/gamma crystallin-related protein [Ktedonobacteraceae bacterium]
MASQVTLFADPNFKGASIVITEPTPDLSKLNFNDRASSAIIEGKMWNLYYDTNYQGGYVNLIPGEYADLGSKGINDKISSLRTMDDQDASNPSSNEQVVFVQPPSY